MAAEKKRIAVIGGGICGIGSIISLTVEGLEPVCFEARDAPGGTWYYSEESVEGYASIMPTTVWNVSKELSSPSNFPPRKEFSVYMRHSEAYRFFMEYCKHFGCEKYMRFNTEVTHVKRCEDYAETGRFQVTVRDKTSGNVSTDVYDGVVVCTGHFNIPRIQKFPGQERFKGNVIHTHSLKGAEKFKGQNVLIIGSGCSALDAAEAISDVAKQVYLSTRSGVHVISKVGPSGFPTDYILYRRYLNILLTYLPANLVSWYVETFYLDTKFDHRLCSVEPNYHLFSKDPILNDAIPSKLLSGSVVMKGPVKNFTERGVVFDGEEQIMEIDSVITATGYKWDYPFLEKGLLETEDGRINLYKSMYPTQLPHSSLVFLGFVNPFGLGVPISEMQTRWAARIFAGKAHLPTREVMQKHTVKRYQKNLLQFTPSEFTSVQILNCIDYLDDIASEIGVKPNLFKYLITDFPLFLKLFFGPFLSYQYRLQGPHKWEGARDAIMSCHERVAWPLARENYSKKSVVQLIIEFIVNLVPRNIFLY